MYCNRRASPITGRHAARAGGRRTGTGRSAGPAAGRGAGIIAARPSGPLRHLARERIAWISPGPQALPPSVACIFAFATNPQGDTQVITQTKSSLGRSTLPSLACRIISATVPTNKGDVDVGRFVVDGESDRSVHDMLASYGSTAEAAEKTRAEDFLRTALAGGPRRTKDVEEEAKQIHGIAKRTLKLRTRLAGPAGRADAGRCLCLGP